tara:strand:+ start:202 stop:435 length:234 start_codon:yes stop_codon:yes gene_type:complete
MRKYLFRVVKYELHYIECEDKNSEDAIDVLLQTNENDSKIDEFYGLDAFNNADAFIEIENDDIEKAKAELKEGLEDY